MCTHIIERAYGLMGLKDSSGVGGFLQAPRLTNTDYLLGRLLRSFLRFGRRINLLWRQLVDDNSVSDRGSSSKSFWVLLITEKRRKKIESSIKDDNKKLNI
jgi:hypothetical protein